MGLDIIISEKFETKDSANSLFTADKTYGSFRGWASLSEYIKEELIKKKGDILEHAITETEMLYIIRFIDGYWDRWYAAEASPYHPYIAAENETKAYIAGYNAYRKESFLEKLEDALVAIKSGRRIELHISN